jgi:RNA polymerase sigma-70 factor, ECF subfamily
VLLGSERQGDVSDHPKVLVSAAGGDDEALAFLVRTYHDRVYRFGRHVCRDGYDADDAVQHAFTKLATRPDVARDPNVLSWLFMVVRNACLRMLRPFARERKTLGERVEDPDAVASEALDPQAALERWRLVHAVHRAIAALGPPYREVLVMRDLEGLTGRETCLALGLTEATMKTRLHQARTDLRRELERLGVARARGASN